MPDYWIKDYIKELDDAYIATLPDRLYRRRRDLRLFAGALGGSGALPTLREIAWKLRMPLDLLQLDLEQLCNWIPAEANHLPLLVPTPSGYFIPGFAEEQGPSPAAERKRQSRARHRGGTPVTKRDLGHAPETENREQINRIQINREQSPDTDGDLFQLPLRVGCEGALSLKIWTDITGMLAYPGDIAQVVEKAVTLLLSKYPDPAGLVAYLKPFWDAWTDPARLTQDGLPYSIANPAWLTNWAITGYIPPIKHSPALPAETAPTHTPAGIAARLKQEARHG